MEACIQRKSLEGMLSSFADFVRESSAAQAEAQNLRARHLTSQVWWPFSYRVTLRMLMRRIVPQFTVGLNDRILLDRALIRSGEWVTLSERELDAFNRLVERMKCPA